MERFSFMHANYYEEAEFSDLIGKTITSIVGLEKDSEEVTFICNDGLKYKMFHMQDCCERVSIEDVCGDVDDLLDTPIIVAAEDMKEDEGDSLNDDGDWSYTWTFYNLATIKGHVTIRWYGSSNGYYSESVDFCSLKTE